MKRKIFITILILTLLYSYNTFATEVMKFVESFWYTNVDGYRIFFVKDVDGKMDFLRNVNVGINEENDFVYTSYYFDMYGHCYEAQDDIFPDFYINCYVGPVGYYRKENERDGIVVIQNDIMVPNIQ